MRNLWLGMAVICGGVLLADIVRGLLSIAVTEVRIARYARRIRDMGGRNRDGGS